MIPAWQAVLVALALSATAESADEGAAKFQWNPPNIGAGVFTSELGMLDRERDEYANSLAGYALNRVAMAKASVASLNEARRLVALALQLSSRNKKAIVLRYQLSKGSIPEAVPGDYQPDVLARLLFERSLELKKQGGVENTLLARIFTELSAEMDPKNEDAVYASEIQRLDHGSVNWNSLTDAKGEEGKKEEASKPEKGDVPP
ncbi:hypothetical protein [Haloferula sp. BvORR071]|uniref:hypothetical protein n=1 Tax=Haloferula sp. BvORR071 TaxID=1396141 RepID=UPI00054F512E|nr:hypothetical protein [Haloferula sp. BvORR071]